MWPNNTITLVTNNSRSLPSLQEIDYQQFLVKDIPAVVFLAILSVVGTVGNVHTLLVYTKSPEMAKLAVRIFIIWLSATDLIGCVACMPFEIFDIRFSYTFSSVGACKFFRYLNHVVTLSSGGLLTAIAIERFKINARGYFQRYSKPRLVLSSASIIIVVISVLISTPAFVFYGLDIKETHIADLNGTDCTILAEYKSLSTAGVYTGIVIFLSTICCVVCVVLYSKILYVICFQMKKEISSHPKSNDYVMNSSTEQMSKETQQVSTIQINEIAQSRENISKSSSNEKKIHKRSKYEKGRQLTISLIVATAVSYLGYLIYAATILVKIVNPDLYKNSIQPATGILLRAYFINNAANPIVFCFLDSKFRKECLKLYRKSGKK